VQRVIEIKQPHRRAGNIHIKPTIKGNHAAPDYSDVLQFVLFVLGPAGRPIRRRRKIAARCSRCSRAHTLYLFGTIHVGARFLSAGAALAGLLKKAPVLALEIDPLGDPQKLARAVQRMASAARACRAAGVAPAAGALAASSTTSNRNGGHHEALAAGQPADGERVCRAGLRGIAGGGCASVAAGARRPESRRAGIGRKPDGAVRQDDAAEQLLFLQEAIAGIEDKEQAKQAREIADAWRKADVAALEALALKAEQDDTFRAASCRRCCWKAAIRRWPTAWSS
jgi:hypothetical protein